MARDTDILAEAFALHRKGELAAAETKYLAALKANRSNPDTHYLLGMLYLDQGDLARATKHLEEAISVCGKTGRAADPEWRLALGAAWQRLGDHDAALEQFEAVLKEAPDSVDALFCRASALYETGRQRDAIAAYEKLLQLAPDHAEAANNLGVAYGREGRPGDAIGAFRAAVRHKPDYIDALCNLGSALSNHGQAHNAVVLLRRAADSAPTHAELQLVFFRGLIEAGLVDELARRAREAVRRHPGNADLLAMLGSALQFQGRNEESVTNFREAVAIDPGCSRAQQGLAELDDPELHEAGIEQLTAYLDASANDEPANPGLWFALAGRYKAAGRQDDAIAAFARANGLRREEFTRRGYGYDRAGREREVAAIRDAFPAGSLDAAGGSDSAMPLFIVGMPRSGTTLIEQILAGHPAIFGAGELGHIRQVAGWLQAKHGYPGDPAPAGALAQAAARYLETIGRLAGAPVSHVTDKMPQNFNHLGLIARLFPNARIIHCRRDPMDTCLSCHEQNFQAGGLSWSCDLADTGHYYCQYRKLMAHWRQVLPAGRMLAVDYEETVADLETQARRMIDLIGLEWDDACLAFHETERAVVTASRSQVRSPVYTSSVGRWRRYGDRARPLAEALAECGCGPA